MTERPNKVKPKRRRARQPDNMPYAVPLGTAFSSRAAVVSRGFLRYGENFMDVLREVRTNLYKLGIVSVQAIRRHTPESAPETKAPEPKPEDGVKGKSKSKKKRAKGELIESGTRNEGKEIRLQGPQHTRLQPKDVVGTTSRTKARAAPSVRKQQPKVPNPSTIHSTPL